MATDNTDNIETLRARNERLQNDADEVRALLREAGVSGFGSLREGFARLRGDGQHGPLFVALTREEIATVILSILQREQILARADKEKRLVICMKHAALEVAVKTIAEHLHVDAIAMLEDIETGLALAIPQVMTEVKKGRKT